MNHSPSPSRRFRLALLISLLPATPLMAFEPVQGAFVARQDCPATTGIKARPDGVSVKPGARYAALGLNKPDGDYLQVRVPGARPEPRWVARACGDWPAGEASDAAAGIWINEQVKIHQPPLPSGEGWGEGIANEPLPADPSIPPAVNPPAGQQAPAAPPARTPGRPGRVLLALSWQPAFCERQSSKPECQDQTVGRFDADHLSLHGLWPQPHGLEYCQVDARTRALDRPGNWMNLPAPDLQEDTLRQLRQAMPGAASGLERHEWVRHGRCFGADADPYFRTALALLEQVNRSPLRDTLARRVGGPVAVSELKAAFEQGFGPGASGALSVRCQRDGERALITELRLSLRQPLNPSTPLREALDTSSGERDTCQTGLVDGVGNQ